MTKQEIAFIVKLLKVAETRFAAACCNDLSEELESHFTQAEWDKINKECRIKNGDPEMYRPGEILPDWFIMWYFSEKLNEFGKTLDLPSRLISPTVTETDSLP